jgi:AcrR family transcriptional regulator
MRHNVRMAVKRNSTKRGPVSRNRNRSDPRVLRTRNALGNALVQLMTERAFESITVQDVLDRARVGRSTFYVHYDGKDDLLTSDADRFFGFIVDAIGGDSKRVLPVRELLLHVATMRDFRDALRNSGKYRELLKAAETHFARGIERRLAASPRAREVRRSHLEPIAVMYAGALIALLEWWVDRGEPITAEEADMLFHSALWKSVGA